MENDRPTVLNHTVPRMSAQQVFELVKDDLLQVEEEFARQVQSSVYIIHEIGRYLVDGGGKRIRPALLLLAARMFGRSGSRDVIRMASVIEFLHTATLIHDDIIDDAELRRGRPSVNAYWGNETTVLMGDWLYMVAFETSLEERNFKMLDMLTRATRKMVEGELIELMHVGNLDLAEAIYFDIIRRKTAYLFCASVEIGGLLGGATPEELRALHDYGMNLGTAFQLVDDVLDFASSEDALGKPAGNDLKEGKLTLPLIYLMERGDPALREMIATVIRDRDYTHVARPQVLDALISLGALERAREEARAYGAAASDSLDPLSDSPYKVALQSLTHFVLHRSK